MTKYIIKNCPCYFDKPEADCWADQLSWCKNIDNCPLKQIVEMCKKDVDFCKKCSVKANYQVDCIDCTQGGRAELGCVILKLLDIQEVE